MAAGCPDLRRRGLLATAPLAGHDALMAAAPLSRPAVVAELRAAGCVFAEDEARLLRRAARNGEGDLPTMLARRIAGEPLEVVLGWAEFRGLRVRVRPGVFVPRRRTGFLVDRAAAVLRPGAVVVDLCCGTGAVALALATGIGGLEVHAADIDPVAVACARDNLGPVGGAVHRGDLYDALPAHLRGRVTALAVNAPYVPSAAIASMPPEARDHEPVTALDGGPDGVALHRRVAAGAAGWLAPGGRLLIETSRTQAHLTARAMTDAGLDPVVRRARDGVTAVVLGAVTTSAGGPAPRP